MDKNNQIDTSFYNNMIAKNTPSSDFNDILYNKQCKLFYTPLTGLSGIKLMTYTEHIHLIAKVFFKILEYYDLEYYVFGGSSVGYIRNGKNIPWIDDYDIIIFENSIDKFENKILPILKKNGFINTRTIVGYTIFTAKLKLENKDGCSNFFDCDIFYSKLDKNNNVICLYDNINDNCKYSLPYDVVVPRSKKTLDDLELYFINKPEEEVRLYYGDIMNRCVINMDHGRNGYIILDNHYQKYYKLFEKYKDIGIKNTKKYIYNNTNYKPEKELSITKKNTYTILELLKYIDNNNIGKINILDENQLKHVCNIKYYFKDIKITFYVLTEIDYLNILYLNYTDIVYFKDIHILYNYSKRNIHFINIPEFKIIHSSLRQLFTILY